MCIRFTSVTTLLLGAIISAPVLQARQCTGNGDVIGSFGFSASRSGFFLLGATQGTSGLLVPVPTTPPGTTGAMIPVAGRKYSGKRQLRLTARDGDRHECIAEAFTQGHQVFVLIHAVKMLTATTIILPKAS